MGGFFFSFVFEWEVKNEVVCKRRIKMRDTW